jgi:hypothetical protein
MLKIYNYILGKMGNIIPPKIGGSGSYSFLSGRRRTLFDLHLGQRRSWSPFLGSGVFLYSKPQWRHLSCSSILLYLGYVAEFVLDLSIFLSFTPLLG